MRATLFSKADRPGYSQLKIAAGRDQGHHLRPRRVHRVQPTGHRAVREVEDGQHAAAHRHQDRRPAQGADRDALGGPARDLPQAPLLDPYDVYQHLMDYWAETMQDDALLIAQDGWKAVLDGKPNTDLIPAALIVARYFAAEQAAIEQLEAERDAHQPPDGGNGRGTRRRGRPAGRGQDRQGQAHAKSVTARLKAIKGDTDAADERKVLEDYLALIEQEAAASKKVKDAQKALDAKVVAKYGQLTEAEIKTLVVDDKWLATLAADVQGELDRVSQALTGRIRQLAERYATPLPKLTGEVETLAARVDEHLKKMGAVWN